MVDVASTVGLLDGEKVQVVSVGTVKISQDLILNNVLCIPTFSFNLLSARRLAKDSQFCLIFSSEMCVL